MVLPLGFERRGGTTGAHWLRSASAVTGYHDVQNATAPAATTARTASSFRGATPLTVCAGVATAGAVVLAGVDSATTGEEDSAKTADEEVLEGTDQMVLEEVVLAQVVLLDEGGVPYMVWVWMSSRVLVIVVVCCWAVEIAASDQELPCAMAADENARAPMTAVKRIVIRFG